MLFDIHSVTVQSFSEMQQSMLYFLRAVLQTHEIRKSNIFWKHSNFGERSTVTEVTRQNAEMKKKSISREKDVQSNA